MTEIINKTINLQELLVYIQLIKFSESTYIWIGDGNASFDNLNLSLPVKQFSDGTGEQVLSSELINDNNSDDFGQRLSSRLSKNLELLIYYF
jgi:hypothetical protein